MSQYVFGSGSLVGTPTADAYGNVIATPTPVKFGALQDVAVDMSFDTKMLYGPNQFPIAIGRGKGKVTGKAAFAQINGALWNELMFGQTQSALYVADYIDSTGVAAAGTNTPTPPSSGTWAFDLGVVGPNGTPFVRVSSAPTSQQYSVAGGVYTFNAADVGSRVYISFQYSAASTTARASTVANLPMGYAPTFQADMQMPFAGKFLTFSFPNCVSTKLGISTKLDDFAIPSFEFDVFANAAGAIFTYGMSDA